MMMLQAQYPHLNYLQSSRQLFVFLLHQCHEDIILLVRIGYDKKNTFGIAPVLCLILSYLCLELFHLMEAAIARKRPNMPTAPQTPIIESAPHHML
jgi:hypothetical protein